MTDSQYDNLIFTILVVGLVCSSNFMGVVLCLLFIGLHLHICNKNQRAADKTKDKERGTGDNG